MLSPWLLGWYLQGPAFSPSSCAQPISCILQIPVAHGVTLGFLLLRTQLLDLLDRHLSLHPSLGPFLTLHSLLTQSQGHSRLPLPVLGNSHVCLYADLSLEHEIHLSAQGTFLPDVSQATKLQYIKTPCVTIPLKLAPLPALARDVNGNVLLRKPETAASLLALLTPSSLTFNDSTSPITRCHFPNSSQQHLSPGLLLRSADSSS